VSALKTNKGVEFTQNAVYTLRMLAETQPLGECVAGRCNVPAIAAQCLTVRRGIPPCRRGAD
jgi:hypothetical protein